jgi:hypothetical protein
MAHKQKKSAQLPIGSYEWAKARVLENPIDPYALAIILQNELAKTGHDRPGVVI